MASRVNAASQPKTTTAQATPTASVRPTPCTRAAPQVTTRAAATPMRRGREPSSSGPITASTAGTQATATPSTAGSACRDPSTRATLNTTRPVTAIPHSQSHSVPRGMLSRRPVIRASTTRSRQAAAYRSASAVKTGRPDEDRGNRDAAAHADHGRRSPRPRPNPTPPRPAAARAGRGLGARRCGPGAGVGARQRHGDAMGGFGRTNIGHSVTLWALWSSEQGHWSEIMMDQWTWRPVAPTSCS